MVQQSQPSQAVLQEQLMTSNIRMDCMNTTEDGDEDDEEEEEEKQSLRTFRQNKQLLHAQQFQGLESQLVIQESNYQSRREYESNEASDQKNYQNMYQTSYKVSDQKYDDQMVVVGSRRSSDQDNDGIFYRHTTTEQSQIMFEQRELVNRNICSEFKTQQDFVQEQQDDEYDVNGTDEIVSRRIDDPSPLESPHTATGGGGTTAGMIYEKNSGGTMIKMQKPSESDPDYLKRGLASSSDNFNGGGLHSKLESFSGLTAVIKPDQYSRPDSLILLQQSQKVCPNSSKNNQQRASIINQKDAAMRNKHFFSVCDGSTLIPDAKRGLHIQSPQANVPKSKVFKFQESIQNEKYQTNNNPIKPNKQKAQNKIVKSMQIDNSTANNQYYISSSQSPAKGGQVYMHISKRPTLEDVGAPHLAQLNHHYHNAQKQLIENYVWGQNQGMTQSPVSHKIVKKGKEVAGGNNLFFDFEDTPAADSVPVNHFVTTDGETPLKNPLNNHYKDMIPHHNYRTSEHPKNSCHNAENHQKAQPSSSLEPDQNYNTMSRHSNKQKALPQQTYQGLQQPGNMTPYHKVQQAAIFQNEPVQGHLVMVEEDSDQKRPFGLLAAEIDQEDEDAPVEIRRMASETDQGLQDEAQGQKPEAIMAHHDQNEVELAEQSFAAKGVAVDGGIQANGLSDGQKVRKNLKLQKSNRDRMLQKARSGAAFEEEQIEKYDLDIDDIEENRDRILALKSVKNKGHCQQKIQKSQRSRNNMNPVIDMTNDIQKFQNFRTHQVGPGIKKQKSNNDIIRNRKQLVIHNSDDEEAPNRENCGLEGEEGKSIDIQSVDRFSRVRVSANAANYQTGLDRNQQLSAFSGEDSQNQLYMSAEMQFKRQPGRFQEIGRVGCSTLTVNENSNTNMSQAIVSRYRVRQVPVSNTPKRLRNISSSQKKTNKEGTGGVNSCGSGRDAVSSIKIQAMLRPGNKCSPLVYYDNDEDAQFQKSQHSTQKQQNLSEKVRQIGSPKSVGLQNDHSKSLNFIKQQSSKGMRKYLSQEGSVSPKGEITPQLSIQQDSHKRNVYHIYGKESEKQLNQQNKSKIQANQTLATCARNRNINGRNPLFGKPQGNLTVQANQRVQQFSGQHTFEIAKSTQLLQIESDDQNEQQFVGSNNKLNLHHGKSARVNGLTNKQVLQLDGIENQIAGNVANLPRRKLLFSLGQKHINQKIIQEAFNSNVEGNDPQNQQYNLEIIQREPPKMKKTRQKVQANLLKSEDERNMMQSQKKGNPIQSISNNLELLHSSATVLDMDDINQGVQYDQRGRGIKSTQSGPSQKQNKASSSRKMAQWPVAGSLLAARRCHEATGNFFVDGSSYDDFNGNNLANVAPSEIHYHFQSRQGFDSINDQDGQSGLENLTMGQKQDLGDLDQESRTIFFSDQYPRSLNAHEQTSNIVKAGLKKKDRKKVNPKSIYESQKGGEGCFESRSVQEIQSSSIILSNTELASKALQINGNNAGSNMNRMISRGFQESCSQDPRNPSDIGSPDNIRISHPETHSRLQMHTSAFKSNHHFQSQNKGNELKVNSVSKAAIYANHNQIKSHRTVTNHFSGKQNKDSSQLTLHPLSSLNAQSQHHFNISGDHSALINQQLGPNMIHAKSLNYYEEQDGNPLHGGGLVMSSSTNSRQQLIGGRAGDREEARFNYRGQTNGQMLPDPNHTVYQDHQQNQLSLSSDQFSSKNLVDGGNPAGIQKEQRIGIHRDGPRRHHILRRTIQSEGRSGKVQSSMTLQGAAEERTGDGQQTQANATKLISLQRNRMITFRSSSRPHGPHQNSADSGSSSGGHSQPANRRLIPNIGRNRTIATLGPGAASQNNDDNNSLAAWCCLNSKSRNNSQESAVANRSLGTIGKLQNNLLGNNNSDSKSSGCSVF